VGCDDDDDDDDDDDPDRTVAGVSQTREARELALMRQEDFASQQRERVDRERAQAAFERVQFLEYIYTPYRYESCSVQRVCSVRSKSCSVREGLVVYTVHVHSEAEVLLCTHVLQTVT
jgi:hypothetical protein